MKMKIKITGEEHGGKPNFDWAIIHVQYGMDITQNY